MPQQVEKLLDPLKVSDDLKADAWDAFYESATLDDFKARIDKIGLPDTVKADLWDLKAAAAPAVKAPVSATPPTLPGGMWSDQLTGVMDLLKGAGKSVMGTGLGVSKLLGAVPPDTTMEQIGMEPQNTMQSAGKTAGDIGQFLIPGAVASKVPRLAQIGSRVLGRAAIEGVGAGAVATMQTGDTNEGLKALLIGGTIPIAIPAVGKVVAATGRKIQESVLRSSASDRAAGFNIMNVFKHKVGGSPQDVANKSAAKITKLAKELQGELASTPNAEIDVLGLLADAQQEMVKNASSQFGRNAPTQTAFNKLLDELNLVTQTGKVNIADAQAMKRSLGLLGSWIEGSRDPEAKGMQIVANAMYTKLRTAIENTALNGARVKAINRELGELIPIEHVAVKRIPVTERQNLASLTDVIALVNVTHSPANFYIFLLNKLSKSGKVGSGMVTAGTSATGKIAAPVAAGIATERKP